MSLTLIPNSLYIAEPRESTTVDLGTPLPLIRSDNSLEGTTPNIAATSVVFSVRVCLPSVASQLNPATEIISITLSSRV